MAQALDSARGGPVEEGNVGGGTKVTEESTINAMIAAQDVTGIGD